MDRPEFSEGNPIMLLLFLMLCTAAFNAVSRALHNVTEGRCCITQFNAGQTWKGAAGRHYPAAAGLQMFITAITRSDLVECSTKNANKP